MLSSCRIFRAFLFFQAVAQLIAADVESTSGFTHVSPDLNQHFLDDFGLKFFQVYARLRDRLGQWLESIYVDSQFLDSVLDVSLAGVEQTSGNSQLMFTLDQGLLDHLLFNRREIDLL